MRDVIRSNLKSGLTVAFISIPLSVSLAVASGAAPTVGIITAIWAGLIAAIFGGSHFNVVGPVGALSGVAAAFVIMHGANTLPMLALLSGVMIGAAYLMKLERYLVLIPSSVMHGFTLGVAFIIGLGQLNNALGLRNLPVHERLFENILESLQHFSSISGATFAVFLLFLSALMIFRRVIPKIPGAIILATIGILLGYLSTRNLVPFSLQTLGGKFGDIGFRLIELPHFGFSVVMIKTAAVVALIAILDTLLSAKIADVMTKTKHDQRKEMLGVGLANIVSGLVGGMPATASLSRTALNIEAGATHRASAMINVLSVLVISYVFLAYFKYIPLAVIAAMLVFVAIQMVSWEPLRKLWRYEKSGFFVSLLVALLTVVIDPIIAIVVGVAISLILFVDGISRGRYEVTAGNIGVDSLVSNSHAKLSEIEENAEVLLYSFRGSLSYINSRAHLERFAANFTKYKYIILRMREIPFIDMDGVEAIDEIIDLIESRGQKVIISSITQTNSTLLVQLSSGYKRLNANGFVFAKTGSALGFLGIPTVSREK